MIFRVRPSNLSGSISIPASKSHTIRALLIASLAEGESVLRNPLDSADCQSCRAACRLLGAKVEEGDTWRVVGVAGEPAPPEDVIDVGNSGTSARLLLGAASLGHGYSVLTGDAQTRRRPMAPLLNSLSHLGATAFSTRANGSLPAVVKGPLRGGYTRVDGITSQFTSSLLLSTPLARGPSRIDVVDLHERPYVEITLWWLEQQNVEVECEGLERFHLRGRQAYRAFDQTIPADFSSATFFLCAAAMTDSDVTLVGLDMGDPQGDKGVVEILRAMGVRIDVTAEGIRVRGGAALQGGTFDLNGMPDALPALSVVGCRARGKTVLGNVPQARIKETDRIATMTQELRKLGARVEELPDGLVIYESGLKGAALHGHHDHRVVMSLACGGLTAAGETTVDTAEAAAVTFPNFAELMIQSGASLEVLPG